MDSLAATIRLANVIRPIEVPTLAEWEETERVLEFILPREYKLLISSIGMGHFGELLLRNPASSAELHRFTPRKPDILTFHSYLQDLIGNKLPVYPMKNGYFHVGFTGFGCYLFVSPIDRGEICWFDLDSQKAKRLSITVCEFIYGLFNNYLPFSWAKEERALIWRPGEKFFTSRPGLIESAQTESLNY